MIVSASDGDIGKCRSTYAEPVSVTTDCGCSAAERQGNTMHFILLLQSGITMFVTE